MTRRTRTLALALAGALAAAPALPGCRDGGDTPAATPRHDETPGGTTMSDPNAAGPGGDKPPVVRTDAEWRKLLTPDQFRITRQAATEAPFTGEYWNVKDAGTYYCVACGQPLFLSDTKFESGCGWPSFFQAVKPGCIIERVDRSHGMERKETLCSRCGAHLGHVFDDGPPPTHLRFCINSGAMRFVPAGGQAPPLLPAAAPTTKPDDR